MKDCLYSRKPIKSIEPSMIKKPQEVRFALRMLNRRLMGLQTD